MGGQHQDTPLKRGLKTDTYSLLPSGAPSVPVYFSALRKPLKWPARRAVSYAIGGFIAFLIMRQLGEMVVEEPVAGSFSHFAYKYWGDFAGFLSGWNYWAMFILVGMAELTAVGIYIQYWWPEIPTWASAALFSC